MTLLLLSSELPAARVLSSEIFTEGKEKLNVKFSACVVLILHKHLHACRISNRIFHLGGEMWAEYVNTRG